MVSDFQAIAKCGLGQGGIALMGERALRVRSVGWCMWQVYLVAIVYKR